MRVAVLRGGRSSEHEVSLRSGESVAAGLRDAGHEVVDVLIAHDGRWTVDGAEVELRAGDGLLGCDVAFPALHGPFGEDGTVQGLLECLGVPYVGAGVLASAVCMDKVLFKEVMAGAGVPQVDYVAVRDGQDRRAEVETLGLPVFVKPARLGSSVGIARVASAAELDAALADAFRHDPLVIVEAAAGGLEVECSVIGNQEPVVSEPGQILLTGGEDGWYDYEAKYTPGGMELVVPPPIAPGLCDRVRELAVEAFVRSRCEGLARVDFFVDPDRDEVLVNELNTIPGFTQTSVFARLFEASDVAYPDLLDRLVGYALERHEREARYSH